MSDDCYRFQSFPTHVLMLKPPQNGNVDMVVLMLTPVKGEAVAMTTMYQADRIAFGPVSLWLTNQVADLPLRSPSTVRFYSLKRD